MTPPASFSLPGFPGGLALGFPGGGELWIVLVIVLLLFGRRLPGVARSLGQGISSFKKGLSEPVDEPDDTPADTKKADEGSADTKKADDA